MNAKLKEKIENAASILWDAYDWVVAEQKHANERGDSDMAEVFRWRAQTVDGMALSLLNALNEAIVEDQKDYKIQATPRDSGF